MIAKDGRYAYRGDIEYAYIKKLEARLKEKENSEQNQSDLDYQIAENERLIREHEKELNDITKRCWEYMSRRNCLPVDNMAQFKYWIK